MLLNLICSTTKVPLASQLINPTLSGTGKSPDKQMNGAKQNNANVSFCSIANMFYLRTIIWSSSSSSPSAAAVTSLQPAAMVETE